MDIRIEAEQKALKESFVNISEDKRRVVDGLIYRAAFMRSTLEDLEADITKNGTMEDFQQSKDVAPYQRKRPAVEIYNQTVKNYNTVIRQLTDLLPKETVVDDVDEFEAFVESRK